MTVVDCNGSLTYVVISEHGTTRDRQALYQRTGRAQHADLSQLAKQI